MVARVRIVHLKFFAGLLLSGAIGACAAAPSPPGPNAPTRIELRRTACFGNCPVYRVSIDAAGKVEFLGEDFVATKGAQTVQKSPADFAALTRQLQAMHFADLAPRYARGTADCTRWATDHAALTIRVERANGAQQLDFDLGCDTPLKQGVVDLAHAIDQATGSAAWIGGGR